MIVSGRALEVLKRFPRHLDLARPETETRTWVDAGGVARSDVRPAKLFAEVVTAVAQALDVETAQVGRIRRAHRLGHADEERDLLLLAALHDLGPADFVLLGRRLEAIRAARRTLVADPPGSAGATEARAALADLVGPPAATFVPFPSEGADPAPAQARLAAALGAVTAYDAEVDLLRARVRATIALHRDGNGTIAALLGAAANALDLEVRRVGHGASGFWHIARCRDRMRLVRPQPPGTTPTAVEVTPAEELVALEENPFAHEELEPAPRAHGSRFVITRPGFAPVPIGVHVVGVADRTVHPMVVCRDDGRGVAFAGVVPDGQRLVFDRTGPVSLAGADVTGFAYAFTGAVFADALEAHAQDFVFADDGATPGPKAARFAVAAPIDAFAPTTAFPHTATEIARASLAVGASRWSFFVREAHFGTTDAAGTTIVAASPIFAAAITDASVFAGATDPAAKVGFDWEEREPYAVKVWLPARFARLDEGSAPEARAVVRSTLDRHRPAGVHVYVEYADDTWVVGEGVLADLAADEGEGLVVDGTRLSPAPPSP